jgi:YggT family protein
MEFLISFVLLLLQGMRIFLVLGTLLPYILPADNALRLGIARIIDPVLRPLRKLIKPISGFDFTPLVLYMLLILIESLIKRFLVPLVLK